MPKYFWSLVLLDTFCHNLFLIISVHHCLSFQMKMDKKQNSMQCNYNTINKCSKIASGQMVISRSTMPLFSYFFSGRHYEHFFICFIRWWIEYAIQSYEKWNAKCGNEKNEKMEKMKNGNSLSVVSIKKSKWQEQIPQMKNYTSCARQK